MPGGGVSRPCGRAHVRWAQQHNISQPRPAPAPPNRGAGGWTRNRSLAMAGERFPDPLPWGQRGQGWLIGYPRVRLNAPLPTRSLERQRQRVNRQAGSGAAERATANLRTRSSAAGCQDGRNSRTDGEFGRAWGRPPFSSEALSAGGEPARPPPSCRHWLPTSWPQAGFLMSSATGKLPRRSARATAPPSKDWSSNSLRHWPGGKRRIVPSHRPSSRSTRRGTTVTT